jgi:hypothetical protein
VNLLEFNSPPLLHNEGDLEYRILDEPSQPYDGFSPARSNFTLEKAIVNVRRPRISFETARIYWMQFNVAYILSACPVGVWVFNCFINDLAASVDFMSLSPWIACHSQDHMKLGARCT